MISQNVCDLLSDKPGVEVYFQDFEVNGQVVRVSSADRDTIESLRGFFYPYLQIYGEGFAPGMGYELTTIFEPELYDQVKAGLPDSPDHLAVTSLKHDVDCQLRYFSSPSAGITVIDDEALKLLYVISGRGWTKVIATVASRTRTGLLRIIRASWINGRDALVVHGCALEKNGRGIIIAGDKRAGKSTSLLNLCTKKQYAIVANDRLLLSLKGARPHALGVPTVTNLRPETLAPFRELQHLREVPLLGVSDLAQALNVPIKREVDVSAIVFLSYARAATHLAFHPLSNEETLQQLSNHLFARREYDWVSAMKIGAPPPEDTAPDHSDLGRVAGFQLMNNETHLDEAADLLDTWCQGAA